MLHFCLCIFTLQCSISDKGGRYAYEKQPEVCKWNCERLAFALAQLPYMDMNELYPILELFNPQFEAAYLEIMRKKVASYQLLPVLSGNNDIWTVMYL